MTSPPNRTRLAHMVYFSLQDRSAESVEKMVAACHKYLTNHPGTVHFSAGTVSELARPVNVRDYDVGLHIVFADRAAHDAYQEDERHQAFIRENKDNWAQVRVFDTYV